MATNAPFFRVNCTKTITVGNWERVKTNGHISSSFFFIVRKGLELQHSPMPSTIS